MTQITTPKRSGLQSATYLILERDSEILLLQRANTGYMDGMYSFVAGHIEHEESVTAAMLREATEEAGIVIRPEDLHFAHVCRRNSDHDLVYTDFFFRASRWSGDITNMEPDKCSDLSWFPRDALPENTIPYIEKVVDLIYIRCRPFSEYNWETES